MKTILKFIEILNNTIIFYFGQIFCGIEHVFRQAKDGCKSIPSMVAFS